MFARIKPFSGLVNEVLDRLPESIWTSKTSTFLDSAIGGGQFVAEVERRLRANGHSDENIHNRVFGREENKFLLDIAVNRYNLVGQYFVMSNDEYLESNTMKNKLPGGRATAAIGNPPYHDKKGNEESTNSADLYAKFVNKNLELSEKYVALVIPSAWSGPKNSKLKETLFEKHQPTHFNTHGKKWFDVEMNTCYFVTELNRKGTTEVSDGFGNVETLQLDKSSAIPANLSSLKIRDQIVSVSKANKLGNLGNRWIRGNLHLNELVAVETGGHEFVAAVGKGGEPLTTLMISNDINETAGLDLNKLAVPNMASSDSIGQIKLATKDQVGGHSVVFLTGKSDSELKNIKQYLESKLIKFLISSIKISTPNSKQVFTHIPDIGFTKAFTDAELYAYFKLTQAQQDYVENSVK